MTQRADEVGPVVGHIQTDTFCDGCGYNLHTQAVMRDPRLGILVLRCPECGRFAPAGQGTTAARVWLNRVFVVLLGLWGLFVLALFALCATFLGVVAYGHLMNNVRWTPVASPNARGQTFYIYVIQSPPPGDADAVEREVFEQVALGAIAVALGIFTGGLFSVVLWHLKSGWRALAWLAPLAGCGFAALAWANDPMTLRIRGWGLGWIGSYFLLESLALGVGLVLGRPIVRGMLRILVPPGPRQHLAFLWTVDGKRLTFSSDERRTPG